MRPVALEPAQREVWQILFSADGSHLVANLEVGGLEMWPVGQTRSVLAGEPLAAQALQAYLDVFTHHYLQAKHQLPPDVNGAAHARLRLLAQGRT